MSCLWCVVRDTYAVKALLLWHVRLTGQLALDNDLDMTVSFIYNNAVASAMVKPLHRVEARLEEALAGVGLSIAKFETLSIL